MAVTAANLSTFGGIATVSLVHSLIPTHWLPFSVVGRVQKWTIHQTLSITALGAFLHVLSTSILGFTAVTMAHTLAGEEAVEAIADASLGTMAIAVAVLLACTLFVMLTLVALSFYGASQVKFGWLERYEKLVVGVILCAVGILTHLFHHHDHPHGHSHGHAGHAGSVFAPGHTDIITAGTMLSHHH
ncbi:unnamed protein product [Closterium sp. Yama58-4]|nr:unnamed protein product [Closterium sp. Yama58-4]